MKAVILAAGRGSRMADLTAECPKCLVRLAGRTLLSRQMGALRKAGCDEIAIVRGWRGDLLEGQAAVLIDNPDWAETNMVMSLSAATSWIGSAPCIVSYSDIFYPAAAVRDLVSAPGDIAITYDPKWLELWSRRFADPLADAETFRLRPDGTVAEIGRRAANVGEIQGQYMGLLRWTPAGWTQVESLLAELEPDQRRRLDMTSMLQLLIERGTMIQAVPVGGPWGEVDNADDLALYEHMIAVGELPSISDEFQ